jgi:tetratricopeptide (TPR) repeat protein
MSTRCQGFFRPTRPVVLSSAGCDFRRGRVELPHLVLRPLRLMSLVWPLADESAMVRELAERGLWILWNRSGDPAIDALMVKGAAQVQAGELAEALATYSEVVRRKPGFAEGWNRRATAYFLAGDLRRSLPDCDQMMQRNPYHLGALAGYGQIHFRLEHYDKAIEYWRRALNVNPNLAGIEASIARARAKAKRGHAPPFARNTMLGQTEKLDPQPQPDAALGLVTLKEAPPRSST